MQSQAGRIVVGYDGSEAAGPAVNWAAAEAQRRECQLTVLHVLDRAEATPGPIAETPWPSVREEVIRRIAVEGAALARKHADRVDVTPAAVFGPVAATLIEAARDADLLVVGTRGQGDLAATLLGSVSLAVSTHARCPTVVVRGDSSLLPGPDRPIVVGVDESTGADLALRFAAQAAADTGAGLIVVSGYQPARLHVWTGIVSTTMDPRPAPGYVADGRTAAEQTTRVAARTARQAHPGLDVTEQARPGPAASVITAATQEAGLAVVGSRGRGGFAGLLLGSVSHRLLHTALCPVAIVRGAV